MKKLFSKDRLWFWGPIIFVIIFFLVSLLESYFDFFDKLGILGAILQGIMTLFGLLFFALFPILLFLSPLLAVLYIIHMRRQRKRIAEGGGVQPEHNVQEAVQRFYRTKRIILLDFLVAFIITFFIPASFPSYEWGDIGNFMNFVAYLVIIFFVLFGISFPLERYIRQRKKE